MISISIENTSACSADCICCPRDQYVFPIKHMEYDLFCDIVSQLYEFGNCSIDVGGYGDPLIDPEYIRKIRYVKENYPDLIVTSISTCQFLTEEIADAVAEYVDNFKISNYGFTKETFEKVHRGNLDFDTVHKNIVEFLSRTKRPYTSMAYTVFENVNDKEVEDWKAYWEKRADDITIWKPHNFAGSKPEYNSLVTRIGHCRSCGRPGNDFLIGANGDVCACCFDFNHNLKVGNMYEESFEAIYNGEKLNRIKSIHKEGTFSENGLICANCDQIYEREGSLIYSSVKDFSVGMKSQNTRVVYSKG